MSDQVAAGLVAAIAAIDAEVAELNASIDAIREKVDTLVDSRVELVALQARLGGAVTPPTAVAKAPPAARETSPARKRTAKRSAPGESKYDLAEVAEVAREAMAEGVPVAARVMERVGCPSVGMAGFLIKRARRAGHNIPAMRTKRTTTAPARIAELGRRSTNAPFVRLDAQEALDAERRAGLT